MSVIDPKVNPLKIEDLPSYIGKRVCVSRGTPLNPMKENRNGILKYATPDAIGIEDEDGSFRIRPSSCAIYILVPQRRRQVIETG